MDKRVFIEKIRRPFVTLHFSDEEFLRATDSSVSFKRFTRNKIANFLTPWCLDKTGKTTPCEQPGAIPVRIGDALDKLGHVEEEHKNHRGIIQFFLDEIKKDEALIYAPILPVVGFDKNKTYVVFDGNHRLIAGYRLGLKDVLVILVESTRMKKINVNFRCHS